MHTIIPLDPSHYDEMLLDGIPRPAYRAFNDWLQQQPLDWLRQKQAEADTLFRRVGITFAVYGDESGAERLIPFDTIPRVISAAEWKTLEAGCIQRVTALNRFLHDIYHEQHILKAGVVPAAQILTNSGYQIAMQGLDLPHKVYSHIAGVDVIRHHDGGFYVLEDNLRTPSGVSYMLENREAMMRMFPALFRENQIGRAHV